jgi:hypothetical protein
MASIIKSDNGVSSGITGIVQSADSSGQLALQTTTSGGTATTAVTIDNGQNVGLGVTPSAWSGTNGGAFQFGSGYSSLYSYSNAVTLASNVYYNAVHKYFASGVGASFYQQIGGNHYWLQAPSGTAGNAITFTQAMTLNASGNLLVGTTSAPVGGANSAWANPGSTVFSMGPNGGNAFVLYNPSNVGCYVVGGQTGWTGTSDGALKNVIAPITNGLSSIIGLKPTIYSWKSDKANIPYAGLIAQEVQSVLPDLVNDNNGTLGVNYTGVIPYLISAIQELSAQVTSLQATVETQATTIATLQNKIGA